MVLEGCLSVERFINGLIDSNKYDVVLKVTASNLLFVLYAFVYLCIVTVVLCFLDCVLIMFLL